MSLSNYLDYINTSAGRNLSVNRPLCSPETERSNETGSIIKQKRKALGLSQKDMADALGMGKNGDRTLRRWENGEAIPSPLEVREIMRFANEVPFGDNSLPANGFRFIDLFAGIGGIRIPFQELGGQCVFSSEINTYSQKTYFANFGEKPSGDITDFTEGKNGHSLSDIPDFDILLAGFPCQSFSQAGLHRGFIDARGTMVFHIAKIIHEKRPKAFLLENVRTLLTHDKGRTFNTIKDILETEGYSVSYAILKASDYGVPQSRSRIYIVGFDRNHYGKLLNDNYAFLYPESLKMKTAVGDILDPVVDLKYTISDKLWDGHQRRKKENEASGKGFGFGLFNSSDSYTNTLSARYYKDGSEILIDQGPDMNPRKLTPIECRRLQGFPEKFIIPVSDTQAYKQFGNSVSVPVIRAVARNLVKEMQRLNAQLSTMTQPQKMSKRAVSIFDAKGDSWLNALTAHLANNDSMKKIVDLIFSKSIVKNNLLYSPVSNKCIGWINPKKGIGWINGLDYLDLCNLTSRPSDVSDKKFDLIDFKEYFKKGDDLNFLSSLQKKKAE